MTIHSNGQVTNDSVPLVSIWDKLVEFTKPCDGYYGHEIDSVLDLIVQLLDRQSNATASNDLTSQINTTRVGTRIINDLVAHSFQWDQLIQVSIFCYRNHEAQYGNEA